MSREKLNITDARMLKLIEILKETGKIDYTQEFCDVIGLPKQNIRNIKVLRIQSFRLDHIIKACKKYKINANWILGLENEVYRTGIGKVLPLTKASNKQQTKRHKEHF